MARRVVRAAVVTVAVAVCAVAGLVAAAHFGALDALKAPLASAIGQAIDRSVTLDGPIRATWDGGPALAVGGLEIGDAVDGRTVLRAESLVVVLDSGALLAGELAVRRLVISDAVLFADELWRPTAVTASKVSPRAAPDVAFLGLDARVTLVDSRIEPGDGLPAIAVDRLDAALPRDGTLSLSAALGIDGHAMTLEATAGSIADLLEGASWPVDLRIGAMGDTLSITGRIDGGLHAPALDIAVAGTGGNLTPWLDLAGAGVVLDEPYTLAARVLGPVSRLALDDITLSVGETTATGSLTVDLAVSPVTLSGQIDLDGLPAFGEADDTGDDTAALDAAIPYDALQAMALDIDLGIARLTLGHLELVDLRLPLVLKDGALDVTPIDVTVEDQAIEASLHAHALRREISATIRGDGLPLGPALRRWRPDLAMEGSVGTLRLAATAQGITLRDLVASLELNTLVEEVVIEAAFEDSGSVAYRFDRVVARAGTDQDLVVDGGGSIDGIPLSLFLRSGSLQDLVNETGGWPVEFHLGNDVAGVDLAGVLMHPDTMSGLRVEMLVRARSMDRIDALLGTDVPFSGALQAYIHVSDMPDGLRVDWLDATVGESELQGTFEIASSGDLTTINGTLDASSLIISPDGGDSGTVDIDREFRSAGRFNGLEVAIGITADRVDYPPIRLTNVSAQLTVADGVLHLDPVTAHAFGGDAELSVVIDDSAQPPTLDLSFRQRDIDPASVGSDLGLQGLLTGKIGLIGLDIRGGGNSLRSLAESATATLHVQGGDLQVGPDAMPLRFEQLELLAAPGQPTTGTEAFEIGGVPIDLSLSFVPLVDLLTVAPPWQLDGTGSLLGIDFRIRRDVTPALRIYALPVELHVATDDIGTALAPLGVTFPGPVAMTADGTVQVFEDRVAFALDSASLGRSDLAGSLTLSLDRQPQRIDASVSSQSVVLDDLLGAMDSDPQPEPADGFDLQSLLGTAIPPWTPPDVELDLGLDAQRITWSDVHLDAVGAHIVVSDGAIHLDEIKADGFGGRISGSITLQPRGAATSLTTFLDVDGIESGRLLPMLGVADDAQGTLSLEAGIDTSAETVGGWFAALDGFATLRSGEGWIRSGAVRVVNTDMFSALFDPGRNTIVRCVTLDAEFAGGEGQFDDSLVALSDVVILASGGLDLRAMTVNALLDPQSTSGTFLRILAPVEVTGSLLAPDVSPTAGDVIGGLAGALIGAGPSYKGNVTTACERRRQG